VSSLPVNWGFSAATLPMWANPDFAVNSTLPNTPDQSRLMALFSSTRSLYAPLLHTGIAS
jgi:hypothetical protein